MRPVTFLLLALSIPAFSKDIWQSGTIKVVNTNEWCARPGIPDWPTICGLRADQTTLLNSANDSSVRPANPYSQILEIDAPDTIYIIRRTSLDGGLQFQPGAKAQFALDGKHLKIKFDREEVNRNGEVRVHRDQDKTDILEKRAR